MNFFLFVSVLCIGQTCDFVTSNEPLTKSECAIVKQQFLKLPFKPEVDTAAAQCIEFNYKEKVRI